MNAVEYINEYIDNHIKPLIDSLVEKEKELESTLKKIESTKSSVVKDGDIKSINDLFSLVNFSSDKNKESVSSELQKTSKYIRFLKEALIGYENVCITWVEAYSKVRNKLISLCGLDIAKNNED